MLHIIIDGYNLIRQVPELHQEESISLESGRNLLIRQLKLYRKHKKHKITVVFDGSSTFAESSSPYKEGGIQICFSTAYQTADDVIKEMAKEEKNRALIVSSDRSILDFAESCGSAVMDSKHFYEKLRFAELTETKGFLPEESPTKKAQHKRWMTYKKGPSKKLPKKKRQHQKKINKL